MLHELWCGIHFIQHDWSMPSSAMQKLRSWYNMMLLFHWFLLCVKALMTKTWIWKKKRLMWQVIPWIKHFQCVKALMLVIGLVAVKTCKHTITPAERVLLDLTSLLTQPLESGDGWGLGRLLYLPFASAPLIYFGWGGQFLDCGDGGW